MNLLMTSSSSSSASWAWSTATSSGSDRTTPFRARYSSDKTSPRTWKSRRRVGKHLVSGWTVLLYNWKQEKEKKKLWKIIPYTYTVYVSWGRWSLDLLPHSRRTLLWAVSCFSLTLRGHQALWLMVYLDEPSHYSLQQLYRETTVSHTRRTSIKLHPGKLNRRRWQTWLCTRVQCQGAGQGQHRLSLVKPVL